MVSLFSLKAPSLLDLPCALRTTLPDIDLRWQRWFEGASTTIHGWFIDPAMP
jgi:hypothetical protein